MKKWLIITLFFIISLNTRGQQFELGVGDRLHFLSSYYYDYLYHWFGLAFNTYGIQLSYSKTDSSILQYKIGCYYGPEHALSVPLELNYNVPAIKGFSAGLGLNYVQRNCNGLLSKAYPLDELFLGINLNQTYHLFGKMSVVLSFSVYDGITKQVGYYPILSGGEYKSDFFYLLYSLNLSINYKF
ncbi:MAG: hypothetical protein JW798_08535 [Prolixibacteraceae bacterium]|nr:hypothetical protein [Prolixibacteraceae bacterium]